MFVSTIGLICLISGSYGTITSSEETELLNWHNEARQKTASGQMTCNYGSDSKCPPGTIPDLTWSAQAATDSQAYADILATNCADIFVYGHSDRSSTGFGENIAYAGAYPNAPDIVPTVDPWVTDESPCFTYGSSTGTCVIGHFTQVITESTTKVGCGCSTNTCPKTIEGTLWNFESIYCVCQYDPAGNVGSNGIAYPYTETSGDGSTNPITEPPITTSTTNEPDNGGGSSISQVEVSSTHFCFVSSGTFTSLLNSDSSTYTSSSDKPVYGPFSASRCGLTLYIWYPNQGNNQYLSNKGWYVTNLANLQSGTASYYSRCLCNDCDISQCSSFTGNVPLTLSTSSAYSSSSSSKNSKNELIDGLIIGLAIAFGVFIISALIYYCVKRRNSEKTKYNIVEMNNEISNHEYVTMDN